MQKLNNMVVVDEVFYGSKERDKARQEQWLAELYVPDRRPPRLPSRIFKVVIRGLKGLAGRLGQKQVRVSYEGAGGYVQRHA